MVYGIRLRLVGFSILNLLVYLVRRIEESLDVENINLRGWFGSPLCMNGSPHKVVYNSGSNVHDRLDRLNGQGRTSSTGTRASSGQGTGKRTPPARCGGGILPSISNHRWITHQRISPRSSGTIVAWYQKRLGGVAMSYPTP